MTIDSTVELNHGGPMPRFGLGTFRSPRGKATREAVRTSHLAEVLDGGDIVPAVNQIELHPFNYGSRRDIVGRCRERGIVVQGYSPLAKTERLADPTLEAVAAAHGRTTAQVSIRWALQHGLVTIPKSASPDRIRENARVFDFQLSDAEMRSIDALDEDYITSWDPREIA